MPFSDTQLRTVAELIAAQIIESNPLPLSYVTGAQPDSRLGSGLDALQEMGEPQRDDYLSRIHGDLFDTDLMYALKHAIQNPNSYADRFGHPGFFVTKGRLTGCQLLTDSRGGRGGCTPLLRDVLNMYGIPNGYGDLPSFDVFCYADGYIIFRDRARDDTQVIFYEGFNPTHKWVQSVSDLNDCERRIGLHPKPFLIKKIAQEVEVAQIIDGQIEEGRAPYMHQGSKFIVLGPSDYSDDVSESALESNDPEKIRGIRARRVLSSRGGRYSSFAELAKAHGYDFIEINGRYYPKPVTFYCVKEPVVFGEDNRRDYWSAGEYLAFSRGVFGVG